MQKYPKRPFSSHSVNFWNAYIDIWWSISSMRTLIYAKVMQRITCITWFRNLKLLYFSHSLKLFESISSCGKGGVESSDSYTENQRNLLKFMIENELKISTSCGSSVWVWTVLWKQKWVWFAHYQMFTHYVMFLMLWY